MAELCEKCGKRPATCVYTRRIGDREQRMLLCASCAGELGIGMGAMGNFLFGDFGKLPFPFVLPMEARSNPARVKKCDLCGATMEEILQSGKVGCPRCYRTFSEELAPKLARLHGGALYKADSEEREKTPPAAPGEEKSRPASPEGKAAALQKELEAAVAAEDYERAAVLRDTLKALKKEGSEDGMV